MTQKDFDKFLDKIGQLNELIAFINKRPEMKKLIVNCKSHEEVVNLAKRWGFDIGKRWGEY